MIEIHPITDGEELNEYIICNNLPQNAAVLRAYEGGEITGNISLAAEGMGQKSFAMIYIFECNDDFTGELLIRAAVSYAFNRAIPTVRASKILKNAIFDKVGFKTDEQNISISTKNVVHFCKK